MIWGFTIYTVPWPMPACVVDTTSDAVFYATYVHVAILASCVLTERFQRNLQCVLRSEFMSRLLTTSFCSSSYRHLVNQFRVRDIMSGAYAGQNGRSPPRVPKEWHGSTSHVPPHLQRYVLSISWTKCHWIELFLYNIGSLYFTFVPLSRIQSTVVTHRRGLIFSAF